MTVDAELRPNPNVAANQFHGFHVHANPDGEGCEATGDDPATWFVSAGGHLSETGQIHGAHIGDLPSPLVGADGTARLQFTTAQDRPRAAPRPGGRSCMPDPDNFGNVPTGTASTQYRRTAKRRRP